MCTLHLSAGKFLFLCLRGRIVIDIQNCQAPGRVQVEIKVITKVKTQAKLLIQNSVSLSQKQGLGSDTMYNQMSLISIMFLNYQVRMELYDEGYQS